MKKTEDAMRKFSSSMSAIDETMVRPAAAEFQHVATTTKVPAENPAKKASMSEILAAMSGVTCAGVTMIVRRGETTDSHAITRLSVEAAKLKWTVCEMIFRAGGPKRNPDVEEAGIERLLAFLNKANGIIKDYPAVPLHMPFAKKPGGTLRDVSLHIEDILHREMVVADDRPSSESVKETSTYNLFPAAYLPKAEKANREGSTQETGNGQSRKRKANQTPPKFRPSSKAQDFTFE